MSPFFQMHYEDEARRFNFLAGLAFGALLGTGAALLAIPDESPPRKRKRRTLLPRSRRKGWRAKGDSGIRSIAAGLRAGRERLPF